ncbi:serpin family protein [Candidatus Protochlamydia phocaeensis]|uniref:serpin family protein n=1 Tax=Candidatus Protochlamydia phocaeensis TaxID=1414722 RepID=UPI000838346E|nr:serpin family protein [Candidatus Protochlamydia phocaeensis]
MISSSTIPPVYLPLTSPPQARQNQPASEQAADHPPSALSQGLAGQQSESLEQLRAEITSKQIRLANDALEECMPAAAEEIEAVRTGLLTFSLDLFKELTCKMEGSICLSPISIAPILGMIVKGLPYGKAKQKMMSALGCEEMQESRFHAALNAAINIPCLKNQSRIAELKMANGLALGGEANEYFVKTIKDIYQGEVFSIRQTTEPEACINQWISDKTNGKIPHLLSPNSLSKNAIAMLNAISFTALWHHSFEKSRSYEYPFECLDGTSTQAMMMFQKNKYALYQAEEFEMLKMDYQSVDSKPLYQLIFLPKNAKMLPELIREMTPAFVKACLKQAYSQEVNVYLPRLEVDRSVDLLPIFQEMEYPVDEILSHISGRDRLSLIKHQVKVSSNEKGTTGQAATAAVTYKGIDPNPHFWADRPFVYLIMQEDTILFEGTVTEASVLVTAQKAKELDQKEEDLSLSALILNQTLSPEKAADFLRNDKDLPLLFDQLPSSINPYDACRIIQQTTLDGTCFDLIHYTESMQLSFDGERYLYANGKKVYNGVRLSQQFHFTPDDCQLVMFEKDWQFYFIEKDKGKTQARCLRLIEHPSQDVYYVARS